MKSHEQIRQEIRDLWVTTPYDANYLAYKYGMATQSIRDIVKGVRTYPKERRALSAFHRTLGLALIDKRLDGGYDKGEFAKENGLSVQRLGNLEKGYHDITISELIKFYLLDHASQLDPTLLASA